jgi:COP9 signalosome complex subunit 4
MDFEARLASIGQVANQKDKIKGYQDLLAAILQETATDEATTRQRLEQFITAATEDSAGLVVSRQVLTDFTNAVDGASNISAENKKEIYKHALDKVHGRVVSFEEQVMRPKKGAPVRLTSSLVARCNIGTFTPRKLWLNHSVSSVISP